MVAILFGHIQYLYGYGEGEADCAANQNADQANSAIQQLSDIGAPRVVKIIEGRPQKNTATGDKSSAYKHGKITLQERDHLAQLDMASAAKFGIVLTIFGVLLLGFTLKYTRDAAIATNKTLNEAKNATKAAWAAVDVTREIGQKQVKSYLAPENGEWVCTMRNVFAQIHLKNNGQSPCIHGQAKMQMVCFIPVRNSPKNKATYESPWATAGFGTIEPKGTTPLLFDWSDEVFDKTWLHKIAAKEAEILVYIWIKSEDVFGNIDTQVFGSTRVKLNGALGGAFKDTVYGEKLHITNNYQGKAIEHAQNPFDE